MTRTIRDFSARTASEQDAIFANLVCHQCFRNAVMPIFSILEYEEDGIIFCECTCQKCGNNCKLDLRDIP